MRTCRVCGAQDCVIHARSMLAKVAQKCASHTSPWLGPRPYKAWRTEPAHCCWAQPAQRSALAFSINLTTHLYFTSKQTIKRPSKLTQAFTVFSVVPKGCDAHTQPRVTRGCHTQYLKSKQGHAYASYLTYLYMGCEMLAQGFFKGYG
jgi:hypothetical protein